MSNTNKDSQHNHQRNRGLLLAAGISLFLLIVSGGVLSASGTGSACPDWPTCLGSWSLPEAPGAQFAYAHRILTALTTLFLVPSFLAAWNYRRELPLMSKMVFLSSGFFTIQIGLGAWVALQPGTQPQEWLGATHLGLSLFALAGIAAATVVSFHPQGGTQAFLFRSPFGRLSLAMIGLLLVIFTSGIILNANQAEDACSGWPLCISASGAWSMDTWLHLAHRSLVAFVGFFMLMLFFKAWRSQRSQPAVLTSATIAAVLFFAQSLLGAKLVQEFPPYLVWIHQATAVAAWASVIVMAAAAGLAGRTSVEESAEMQEIRGRKGLVRDLLLLTKPVVVLLLLVTTYAGMVIGAQAWPSLSLTFWTLLGGFLAAGGSGAINQYIDRGDDSKMQRTQKRPIPAGRLTPGEGLAFGAGIALSSFYLLVAMVNLLAALLSLAGIIYYVLLYSIFLKKTTVQNIVIGGGAGAIPPLVGWAAATGSLNVPALLLFAIVFMWTPPHFWALALVRRRDYARAGVPMLPVVRGEKETRKQILLYTIELVALTLLLPLIGLGGSVYLVGAAVLGGWLILAAYRVWKEGGNKLAWKMYRYSSMYLAFIFLVLMIDRLR